MVEEKVMEEANRLVKIFGSKADLAVEEIKKVDQWDNRYFWEQVKHEIYLIGGRGFMCGHPSNRTYLLNGFYNCEVCGAKWKSLCE